MILTLLLCCAPLGAQEERPGGGVDGRVAAGLVEALNSRFYRERREAREKLAAMGPAATEILVGALKSDISGVRSGAAMVLGRMKVKDAVRALLTLVEDPSLEVRRRASEALSRVGTEAVDSLRACLKEAEGRRRELIEELIGRALEGAVNKYIDKMAISPARCLYCPGPIEELKKLGPGVLKALEHLSDWQRHGVTSYYALNTIGDLGDPAAKDFLKKKVEDAKASGGMVYRAGASMALAKLGETSFAEELIRDIRLNVYTTTEIGKHSSLGATYLEIGKLDEAEKEFLEAKKMQPQELSYTFRLGCVYGVKGDAKKAVLHLKEAVEKGFVKASALPRIGYFKKIRESGEWKEFIGEALKKEEAESGKEKEEGEEAKEE